MSAVVNTLATIGALTILATVAVLALLALDRPRQRRERRAAMLIHPAGKGDARLAWIDAAVDQALIDGLRAIEDIAIPKPRDPVEVIAFHSPKRDSILDTIAANQAKSIDAEWAELDGGSL